MKLKTTLLLFIFSIVFTYAQNSNIFINPTNEYGPYVWWHWTGSNFSKEGITKDLEAMKSTGIAGATIFNISSGVQETHSPILNNPWPEKTYRSKEYWDAIVHATVEAKRLGIKIGLHNTVGYSTTGGPWITEEKGMKCIVSTKKEIDGGKNISVKLDKGTPPQYKGWGSFKKTATLYKDIAIIAVPVKKHIITENDIINLSNLINNDDILNWKAPDGKWTIYRIGYAPTMANPHPVPDELIGNALEVDKMNKENNIYHWNKVLRPLKEHLSNYLGKTFNHILIDSYEAGNQWWTEGFEKEFKKLKGYDPLPWLTQCIGTKDEQERFNYDYNDVISHMFYEYGFKTGRDLIHKYGMELMFEPYDGQFNTMTCTSLADIPMGEFWTNGNGYINQNVVSAARAEGKHLIAAEAFTSRPENSAWTEDPAFLKFSADGAFCNGVNRMVLHHWVHQPFDDKYQPGISMGWWGTHFNRHQTWFEPGKSFFAYMSRIQYMLQQGEELVDYICLDKVIGHADVISTQRFLEMNINVKNNNIVLPSGRKYRFIVCPHLEKATPEVVKKLLRLSQKGVVIVGKKPKTSPSLCNYPECDNIVQTLGNKIRTLPNIEEAYKYTGLKPFIKYESSKNEVMSVVRKTNKGYIVFMANRTAKPQNLSVTVNVSNLLPELWNPETGEINNAESWRIVNNKQTLINLYLNPNETMFIVLKDKPSKYDIEKGNKEIKIKKAGKSLTIKGKWDIEFKPKIGDNFNRTFYQLIDFKYNTDKEIMYFSGTAVYSKIINVKSDILENDEVWLSLGELNDIARVYINGTDAGVWWYPPYRKNIKRYLNIGENKIRIEVTNNWANCLIGDEQIPADFEWGTDRGKKMGKAMKAFPEWFVKNEKRPSDRKAFVIWYYHYDDSELQPAGLVGPVTLECFN